MQIEQVRKITIQATAQGVDQTAASLGNLAQASDTLARAQISLADAVAKSQQQLDAAMRAQQNYAQVLQQLKAANDNAASSINAANDNYAGFGKTVVDHASDFLTSVAHLKLLAVAAYALSPAFRSFANTGATAALGQLGAALPTVASAATRVVGVLSPAISLFARLSLPIAAAVGAWQVLNATIERGAELLDKYGTAGQRARFADEGAVSARLTELTKFQQETLTPDQITRAGELARRLEDAKQTLSEFAKIQFDLTEPALHLQSIWVSIVETIARGVNILPNFKPPGTGAGAPFVDPMSGAIIGGSVDESGNLVGSAKGNRLAPSASQLRQQGLSALSTAMSGGFAGRFAGIIPEKETKDVKELTGEFDRLEKSIQRHIAATEADAQTVGKSAGEVERLRTEFRLMEAAQQDILKNGGNLDDYSERIAKLAERAGEAAQALAQARLASDIKFERGTLGLSDEDVRIASRLRSVYGDDIPTALASSEAAQLRFNNRVREVKEVAGEFASTFVQGLADGKSLLESTQAAAQQLAKTLIDVGTKSLVTQGIGALAEGLGQVGPVAGATSAATILTTAGTSVAAAMVAGATEAAGILGATIPTAAATLPVAGGVAGGEVAAGGVAAGAGLAAGGTAAGSALWGPIAALVAVVAGVGLSKLFGSSSGDQAAQQATQQRLQDFASSAQHWQQLTQRSQLAGIDTSTKEGALAAFDIQAQQQRLDEARQAIPQYAALEQALANERLAIIKKFDDQAAQQEQQAAAARAAALDQLQRSANSATGQGFLNDFADLFKSIADAQAQGFDPALINQLFEAQSQNVVNGAQLTGDAFQKLLVTFPQLAGVVRQFGDTADAVAQRAQSLDDRLFGALNDNSTLAGKLAAFDRDAQRQRTEEAKLGGADMVKLEQTLLVERLKIIDDFNAQAVAAEKQAAQDRQNAINAAAKNIATYLNQLKVGPETALSPSARLAAASSSYAAELGLAQGGNIDAQSQITQFAEDLRKAAAAFYGGGSNYQAVLTQIKTQLLALPVVQTSTDPVVNAITGLGNKVDTTNTKLDTTNTNTADTNTTLTVQKGVLDIINASTAATNAQVTTANTLQTTANSLNTTANSLLQAIQSQTINLGLIRSDTLSIAANTNGTQSNTAALTSANGANVHVVNTVTVTQSAVGLVGNPPVGVASLGVRGPELFVPNVAGAVSANDAFQRMSFGYANDNGGIVAELRALRRENAIMQTQIAKLIVQADANNVATMKETQRNADTTSRSVAAGTRARQLRRVTAA